MDSPDIGTILGPGFRVIRGTHQQGNNISLLFHEILIDIIQQGGLTFRIGTLAGYIIKKHGKSPYSQVIHTLKLPQQIIPILIRPTNILPGVNGPNKIDPALVSHFHQPFYRLCLLPWIGVPPIRRTVIRIILRPINIRVYPLAELT